MPGLRQRQPAHRNRKLLDYAHYAPCMLRLGAPCGIHASVPCHSDLLEHGRGVGCKSGDQYAVPGCPNCHSVFTRERLGRDGYREKWQQAHDEYRVWLLRNFKVKL